MNFQPKLLHGDFSPEHVFFDEQAQQISAVIDFGDVMIGDAAWDFLWIYEDYGLDLLSRMLPTYCETEKAALLQRVFQFSKLSLIDWAVSCHEKDDGDFAEAVTELRILMTQEEWRLNELLSINRVA